MPQHIDAIYEDGVLKPLGPLELEEHQRVRLSVSASSSSSPSTGVRESFYEAASKLGFIGCIHGTPHDLSTNQQYMEGFGKNGS